MSESSPPHSPSTSHQKSAHRDTRIHAHEPETPKQRELRARELRITELINAATLGALLGMSIGLFAGAWAGVQWKFVTGGLGGAFWGTHIGAILFAAIAWTAQQRRSSRSGSDEG